MGRAKTRTQPQSAAADTSHPSVFIGLSGGVDSAVSAALLLEAGYDVTALFIRIALPEYPCAAGEDKREALRVAAHLRIPFREIDLSREYRQKVFDTMLARYAKGETPNPDTLCNREIKFGLAYEYARAQGADFFATGHYARTVSKEGTPHLLAGIDAEKDQSYFLADVHGECFSHTLFPVGGMKKQEVRALAAQMKLPNAKRHDSQGICFLGDLSMEDALARELSLVPGDVLDTQGRKIGEHHGAIAYTIGQRHGFTVHAQSPHTTPQSVIAKDVVQNTITVAPLISTAQEKTTKETFIELRDTNWIGAVKNGACRARLRYRGTLIPARLSQTGKKTVVALKGKHAVPHGQLLVLYRKDRCLGGGLM